MSSEIMQKLFRGGRMKAKIKQQYGCEQNKFLEERFPCSKGCGWKMQDGKCGKLTEIKDEGA